MAKINFPINIRDPIHGFIEINEELEYNLICSEAFQRLRSIRQLGATNWVYPSANHNRFEHSLGVFQLSNILVNKLENQKGLEFSEDDKTIFKIASLLHDIGHAPFSHVSEELGLFEKGTNHESMGETIIRELLGDIIISELDETGLNRIIFIITGDKNNLSPTKFIENDILFSELLTGQIGIDRMDYLLRDSYFLGVKYGNYDLPRLLETMRYNDSDTFYSTPIYWEEGGIHALEQFILARYFMFTEVYFHKTRRILDLYLGEMTKDFLEENGISYLPRLASEYIEYNDFNIFASMIKKEKYRNIFLKREFLKKINIESADTGKEDFFIWDSLKEILENKFEKKDFYFDTAENSPYKYEKMVVNILKGNNIEPLHKHSQLVDHLPYYYKRRIYASKGKKEEIEKYVNEYISSKNSKMGELIKKSKS